MAGQMPNGGGGVWRGVIERDLIGYVEGECRSKAERVVRTKRTKCFSDDASAECREGCRRWAEERGRGGSSGARSWCVSRNGRGATSGMKERQKGGKTRVCGMLLAKAVQLQIRAPRL